MVSEDKDKIEQLIDRIDDILSVLAEVAKDLKTVSSSLKSIAVGQITNKPVTAVTESKPSMLQPKAEKPTQKLPTPITSTPKGSSSTVEDIRMVFPPELDSLLSFEEKNDYVVIKPKQFLGSENFAKIASTVRGIGGEYISAGRDSHFRVYKKKS
ncbi:MAG: hypothetical protein N3D85_06805 [Candidatus Bathyarchaeota archaeon]|nr:hypothetical protein [Candidatus Bathyarchaeota archaeon]